MTSPGVWKNKILTALLDAVYSARQRYRSETPGAGFYNRVQQFRETHCAVLDDLELLVDMDEAEIRSIMGDNVVSDGQRTPKSIVLKRAAKQMIDAKVNVRHARHLAKADAAAVKKAYTSVSGLGWVTFEYFLMLLGQPGIKADTMITRFVNAALREENLPTVDARGAHEILKGVYAETDAARGLGLTDFDHTIWSWQR